MATFLTSLFGVLTVAGFAYQLLAIALVRRFACVPAVAGAPEPASLLKPLHGAEPRLAENLASFLDQEWEAPVELLCGVQRADDPARAMVASLDPRAVEVRDPTPHGANAKVANLINIARRARHDLLVLSDSDIAVGPDYLATIAGTLAKPRVGAVTCLYRGRGDAGGWSRFAAAQIDYHFLPSVLVGIAVGLAKPCMGSTIALRRTTFDAIGGFGRFADTLADDHAMGAAVRDLGLVVAIPPMLVTHACTERSFAELWRHELRWAVTVRNIDPAGFLGALVTYPVVWALTVLLVAPKLGLLLLLVAILARLGLKRAVDAVAGAPNIPNALLPLRDILSFVVSVAAFFTRSVDWRGRALRMEAEGRVSARPESVTR